MYDPAVLTSKKGLVRGIVKVVNGPGHRNFVQWYELLRRYPKTTREEAAYIIRSPRSVPGSHDSPSSSSFTPFRAAEGDGGCEHVATTTRALGLALSRSIFLEQQKHRQRGVAFAATAGWKLRSFYLDHSFTKELLPFRHPFSRVVIFRLGIPVGGSRWKRFAEDS